MKAIKLLIALMSIQILVSCGTIRVWEGRMEYYLPTGEVQSYEATYRVWEDIDGTVIKERMNVKPQDDTLRLIYDVPHIFYGKETTSKGVKKESEEVNYSYLGYIYKVPKKDYEWIKGYSGSEKAFRKNMDNYIRKHSKGRNKKGVPEE